MDEYRLSRAMIKNIELSVGMERESIRHDELQIQKSNDFMSDVHQQKISDLFRRLDKKKGYDLELVKYEVNPEERVQITNKMVDEGKLSTKQKIERHNMRKAIRKGIAENGDFLPGELQNNMSLTGEARVNFVTEAQMLHKTQNKEYNRLLANYKENTRDEISEFELQKFKMRRRFWFDNGGNYSQIETFVRQYKCDSDIVKFFEVGYVKENYSKALKKLNEIKGVAEYINLYPETETLQGITAEELKTIADACENMFKLSLNRLGYNFSEDADTMEFTLERQMASINTQMEIKSKMNIENTVNSIIYRNNLKEVDKELDDKFQKWGDSQFREKLGEKRADLIAAVNIMGEGFYFQQDYEKRMRLLVYYEAQIDYLNTQMAIVGLEEKSNRRLSLMEKINELTLKKNETDKECKLIYGLCENLEQKKEPTVEQMDYYLMKNSIDINVKDLFLKKVLVPHEPPKTTEKIEISQEKLQQNLQKAAELSNKIKKDMTPFALIEMQKELYELNNSFKDVDVSKLEASDRYRVQKIRITSAKARAVALYVVNERTISTMDINNPLYSKLSGNESARITQMYGKVNFDTIRQYAIEQVVIAEEASKNAFAELMNDTALRTKLLTEFQKSEEGLNNVETEHPDFDEQIRTFISGSSLNQYKKKTEQLKDESLTNEEREKLELEIKYLEINQKLHASKYSLSGRTNVVYNGRSVKGDKILRSFSTLTNIPEIAKMSEKDVFDMFHKMSVGVFEEQSASPSELNSYREENLEGLKIYKQKLLAHYKRMYAKYGSEWVDIGEYALRYGEILRDFPESQSHDMLRNDPMNFNFNNPEDRLLYELIAFYRPMRAAMDDIRLYFKGDDTYVAGKIEYSADREWMLKNVNVHRAYLKEHEGELK